MSARDVFSRVAGASQRLFGNEPIVLEDEGAVLYVESGSVGLFAVDVRDGAPAGPRRLLQRLGAGQAVFAVPLPVLHRLRLVLVPIKEATLRRMALADLWQDRATPGSPVSSWVNDWLELLSQLLQATEQPKLPLKLEGAREAELAAGQAACAGRNSAVWCQVTEGELQLLGNEDAAADSDSGPLPLVGDLWARAGEGCRFTTTATASLEDASAVAAGMTTLQALLLRQQLSERERETEAERQRLRDRDLVETQRKAEAYADLAGVLEPRAVRVKGDSPLLRAMTAVGSSLGVEVRAPLKSDSSASQPVEAVLRASRLRARRVQLNGPWWRSDCGALLAFSADEQRRPLALVRTRALKYSCYDPVEDTHTPVDGELAASLEADAWMVYRPLPDGRLSLWGLFAFSLSGHRTELALALLTGVVATLLAMITPQATAVLMDSAIPDADTGLVQQLALALLFAAFGQIVFRLSQGIILMRFGLASSAETQAAVWDRLLRLRPSFFREFSSGDLQSRVTAVSEIGREMSGATLTSLFSGFLALLNLGLLYYYSPALTWLALLIGLVVVVFTGVVGVFVRRNVRELVELDGQRFGMVVQLINGVGKLRVAGAGDRAFTHWMKEYGRSLKLWAGHLPARGQGLPVQPDPAVVERGPAVLGGARPAGRRPTGRRRGRPDPGDLSGVQRRVRRFPERHHRAEQHRGELARRVRQGPPGEADPRGGAGDRRAEDRSGAVERAAGAAWSLFPLCAGRAVDPAGSRLARRAG